MQTGLHMRCFSEDTSQRVPFELGSEDVVLFLLESKERLSGPTSYLGELAYRCSDCGGVHGMALFNENPHDLMVVERVNKLGLPVEFRKIGQMPVTDSERSNGQMDLWTTPVDEVYDRIVGIQDKK